MPEKGQHRKPGMSRLTRICIVAGAGAAAVTVPLVAAGSASAATPAPAAAVVHHTAHAAAKPTTYVVERGDTLSGIARAHHVVGGWHRLYHDNKAVIGADPDMIRPGEHLALNGAANAVHHSAAEPAAPKPAAQAAAARPAAPKPAAQAVAKATADSGYTKPVGDAPIGTPYHAEGSLWSSGYHTGVDFLVGSGTPVHSVAAGTVVSAGADGAYGNDVIIKHADGKYTLYGHLTRPLVSAGQTVTEGQEIGISGATGNVTGPHLHFEVRTTPDYGSDIDPIAYMASHGVTF